MSSSLFWGFSNLPENMHYNAVLVCNIAQFGLSSRLLLPFNQRALAL
jgi:hypothetical protein